MPEQWLPDFKNPRTLANFAGAASIPGMLGYLIARYADGRKSSREGERFERLAEEMAMAENPVVSLDPHLDDTEEEIRLKALGLKHAEADKAGSPSPAGSAPSPETPMFTGLLEPGMMAALAYLSILTGAAAGKKARYRSDLKKLQRQIPKEMNLLEKSEYDRLFQLNDPEGYEAHLAKLNGEQKKAEKIARNSVPKVAYTEGDMLNAAVRIMSQKQTEARILEAVSRTAHVQKTPPAVKEDQVRHTASSAFWWKLGHKTLPWAGREILKGLKLGGKAVGGAMVRNPGKTAALGTGVYYAPEIKKAVGTATSAVTTTAEVLPVLVEKLKEGGKGAAVAGGNVYPVLFASLALTGLAAGKRFADSQDVNRANKKALEKYLNRELTEQQSPALLDVGTTLPWEAARHGGARQAAKGELSEEARAAEEKTSQEIRI